MENVALVNTVKHRWLPRPSTFLTAGPLRLLNAIELVIKIVEERLYVPLVTRTLEPFVAAFTAAWIFVAALPQLV